MFDWLRKLFGDSKRRRRRRSSHESHQSAQPAVPIRPRQSVGSNHERPANSSLRSTYLGLRRQAFTISRNDAGIPAPTSPTRPWGVIMEMGYDGATVSVVAFADGTASIYLSSGGGFIGGAGQPPIRAAAHALVSAADRFPPQMTLTTDFPEPRRGQTIFYLRTDDGIFTASASENELGDRQHSLSPLFHSAQEVITQYRLHEQARNERGA